MCSICNNVHSLGLHASQGLNQETAFIEGKVAGASTAKKLLKKIDRHRDSVTHIKSEKILRSRETDAITQSLKVSQTLFEERHKENIDATVKVFRTAYECAKSQLAFTQHSRLIELQGLNGDSCGNILFSDRACASIVEHVGCEMRLEIIQYIVANNCKFSVLVDESTSVANVQSMVIYLRTVFDSEVCVYFIGLVPVALATAEGLQATLLEFLYSVGLTDEIMSSQFVGFCSDGASTMTGQHNGLAALLTRKFPLLKSFHCMAHRLELAVKNAVDTVNPVSHFRDLVEGLYKIYSMSPKNQREIDLIAAEFLIELMRVQKVFNVRWVFSSFTSVKALLRNFPALFRHFSQLSSPESERKSKEKSKFSGFAKKLQSWYVIAESCMLKDALRCLQFMSLYLQADKASVIDALVHVESCQNKLLVMKTDAGPSLHKFLDSFDADGCYKGIEIVQNASDYQNFVSLRARFFQALYDRQSGSTILHRAQKHPIRCQCP